MMGNIRGLPKLLLIEDDRHIAAALNHALINDYQIDVAPTGKQGLYHCDRADYAAIILDLNLPDISGIDVCHQLRERGAKAPILILSGEQNTLTKINLLDAGADDYLTKPFSLGELKARLRALARKRQSTQKSLITLKIGELELDRGARQAWRNGQPLYLRKKEFAMLACLMDKAGNVVSRSTLKQCVWEGHQEPWTNTIDVHIKYLRDKVDKPFDYPLIKTVHGLGYRLETTQQSRVGAKECRV